VIGRFCACLPYLEFTRPPAVAVTRLRSNPLSFWIRGDFIPAPGAVEQSKPVRVCKYPVNLAQLIPNSEVAGGGWRTRPCQSAPVLGRSNWLHSSHRTFPSRPPTPLCCGRDGRTQLTQKFNFGVRVNRFTTRETNEVPSRIHSRESGGVSRQSLLSNSQRQSVQWVGRRCCAAGYDGRAAARPYRLE
jgi:hypothetical protein